MKRQTYSHLSLQPLALVALLAAGCGGAVAEEGPADDQTREVPADDQSNEPPVDDQSNNPPDTSDPPPLGEKEGPTCPNPRPILRDGEETGVVACSNGVIHRAEAKVFESPVPRPGVVCEPDPYGPGPTPPNCEMDSDCPGALDACLPLPAAPSYICGCRATCSSDADCDNGFICAGTGSLLFCVAANCRTSDDCAYGLCAQSDDHTGCGYGTGYHCHTPDDECLVGSGNECNSCFFREDRRVCDSSMC